MELKVERLDLRINAGDPSLEHFRLVQRSRATQQQVTVRPIQRLLDQVLAYTANVIAQKISCGGQCPVNYVRLLANLLLFSARTLPTDRFDQSPQLPCSVVLLMI